MSFVTLDTKITKYVSKSCIFFTHICIVYIYNYIIYYS